MEIIATLVKSIRFTNGKNQDKILANGSLRSVKSVLKTAPRKNKIKGSGYKS